MAPLATKFRGAAGGLRHLEFDDSSQVYVGDPLEVSGQLDIEDLTTLNGDTVRGEFDVLSGKRLLIFGALGITRQERTNRASQWQTTIYSGISVQF